MFSDTFRDNLRTMGLGLGFTAVIVGTAIAVAFW